MRHLGTTFAVCASALCSVVVASSALAAPNYSDVVLADNPVAYFRLNEDSGSLALSKVNTATHVGSLVGTGGDLTFDGLQSATHLGFDDGNTGLLLDGVNGSGIDLGASVSTAMVGASGITTELWLHESNISTVFEDRTASMLYAGAAAGINIIVRGNNVRVGGRSHHSDFYNSGSYVVLPDDSLGGWIHVVGVVDYANSQIRTYINGVLQDTSTAMFQNSTFMEGAYSTWTDRIGNSADNSSGAPISVLQGGIDEVAYYNRALSDQEVLTHFMSAFEEGSSGLPGDINGDGFVGLDDLDIVLNNWNAGTPPNAGSPNIPEPASLGMMIVGGMFVLRRRCC